MTGVHEKLASKHAQDRTSAQARVGRWTKTSLRMPRKFLAHMLKMNVPQSLFPWNIENKKQTSS
jgi:hypothetical protein